MNEKYFVRATIYVRICALEEFIPWSFALLAIPGLFLKFAGDFSQKPKNDWRRTDFGRTVYRVGGIVIYILIVQMVRGVDLAAWI